MAQGPGFLPPTCETQVCSSSLLASVWPTLAVSHLEREQKDGSISLCLVHAVIQINLKNNNNNHQKPPPKTVNDLEKNKLKFSQWNAIQTFKGSFQAFYYTCPNILVPKLRETKSKLMPLNECFKTTTLNGTSWCVTSPLPAPIPPVPTLSPPFFCINTVLFLRILFQLHYQFIIYSCLIFLMVVLGFRFPIFNFSVSLHGIPWCIMQGS